MDRWRCREGDNTAQGAKVPRWLVLRPAVHKRDAPDNQRGCAVFASRGAQNMQPVRVLIVEDEYLNRELMAEALVEAGFAVDEADSADAAVPMLDVDGYELVVTDIHMPGRMDGIGLAKHMHAQHPKTPVVFVTGRPDVLARLRDAGIPGTSLAKPFKLDELVRVVRALIAETA
jgi:two-component system cell cycle response regulator CpdR